MYSPFSDAVKSRGSRWPRHFTGPIGRQSAQKVIIMCDLLSRTRAFSFRLFRRSCSDGLSSRVFDRERRQDIIDHMKLVADIACGLGARVAVFGSPNNRKRGSLGWSEAWSYAIELFNSFGATFSDRGVVLGVEPNPAEYGCDFLTNARDTMEFVRAIHSPGVGLHLDTGGSALARDDISIIAKGPVMPCHFHASQPNLESFASPSDIHEIACRCTLADWV